MRYPPKKNSAVLAKEIKETRLMRLHNIRLPQTLGQLKCVNRCPGVNNGNLLDKKLQKHMERSISCTVRWRMGWAASVLNWDVIIRRYTSVSVNHFSQSSVVPFFYQFGMTVFGILWKFTYSSDVLGTVSREKQSWDKSTFLA